MTRYTRAGHLVIAGMLAVAAVAQAQDGVDGENPLSLELYRRHPATYTPGEPLEIIVSIAGGAVEEVRALGVREVLPERWTFLDVRGYAGEPPHIQPATGDPSPLEFAWITPPRLPSTFAYIVMVPENDGGNKELFGVVEYRLEGGPHQARPEVTFISGPESEAPTLVLRGANPVEIRQGEVWREPGYTAMDYDNEDISGLVTVSGTVNTASPGMYSLAYEVTSPKSGLSGTAIRIVNVLSGGEDSEPSTPAPVSGPGAVPAPHAAPATRVSGMEQPRDETERNGTDDEIRSGLPDELPDLSGYRPVTGEPEDAGERNRTGAVVGETGGTARTRAGLRVSEAEDRTAFSTGDGGRVVTGSTETFQNGATALSQAHKTRTSIWHWAGGIAALAGVVGGGILKWRLSAKGTRKKKTR